MFDTGAMATQSTELSAALVSLRSRWGAAAPGYAGEVIGALATVPLPADPDTDPGIHEASVPAPADPARVFSTGFAELDAILGPGGVPRGMGVSMRGDASSGRTTLALRLAAEAQAAGGIVAWLDLAAALDPVEAVARGIDPAWLVVVTPGDPDEGLAIAGALLSGRAVDLLIIDLPNRLPRATAGARATTGARGGKAPQFADRLGRLAALARRAGITLLVLEPARLPDGLAAAVGEATGIRLELSRRSWIRLGRDVVGQRTEVLVARNRAGPPGRRATLRILYADGGPRDACLRQEGLFITAPVLSVPEKRNATPSPPSTTSPPRPREAAPALRLVASGSGRPRREALDERDRARRGPGRSGARRPARDAAGVGAPARAGGDLPRRPAGG
jgi:recombination protein RecA